MRRPAPRHQQPWHYHIMRIFAGRPSAVFMSLWCRRSGHWAPGCIPRPDPPHGLKAPPRGISRAPPQGSMCSKIPALGRPQPVLGATLAKLVDLAYPPLRTRQLSSLSSLSSMHSSRDPAATCAFCGTTPGHALLRSVGFALHLATLIEHYLGIATATWTPGDLVSHRLTWY